MNENNPKLEKILESLDNRERIQGVIDKAPDSKNADLLRSQIIDDATILQMARDLVGSMVSAEDLELVLGTKKLVNDDILDQEILDSAVSNLFSETDGLQDLVERLSEKSQGKIGMLAILGVELTSTPSLTLTDDLISAITPAIEMTDLEPDTSKEPTTQEKAKPAEAALSKEQMQANGIFPGTDILILGGAISKYESDLRDLGVDIRADALISYSTDLQLDFDINRIPKDEINRMRLDAFTRIRELIDRPELYQELVGLVDSNDSRLQCIHYIQETVCQNDDVMRRATLDTIQEFLEAEITTIVEVSNGTFSKGRQIVGTGTEVTDRDGKVLASKGTARRAPASRPYKSSGAALDDESGIFNGNGSGHEETASISPATVAASNSIEIPTETSKPTTDNVETSEPLENVNKSEKAAPEKKLPAKWQEHLEEIVENIVPKLLERGMDEESLEIAYHIAEAVIAGEGHHASKVLNIARDANIIERQSRKTILAKHVVLTMFVNTRKGALNYYRIKKNTRKVNKQIDLLVEAELVKAKRSSTTV